MSETKASKAIIHLDMDAFYAAVEILDNPSLAGQPVIVGGLGPRGVVSTASYEARAYGVHSALPMSLARRRCPAGIFLPPRPRRYEELSQHIMDIFRRYTPLVEPLSLDEAFLDVSGSRRLFGQPEDLARRLKAEVRAETGLTVSAGVASVKYLAKIASGMNKPDGLTVVPPGGEKDFLWPKPLNLLWGVGPALLAKLRALGLMTVGDLAALERDLLQRRFGRAGAQVWDLAHGLDEREVQPYREAKSIGAEETFDEDLKDSESIRQALRAQTMAAARRLRNSGLAAGAVTVKFRNADFETITRSRKLAEPSDLRQRLWQTVEEIYKRQEPSLGPIRLLGVSFSRLSRPEQSPEPSLFDQHERQLNAKQKALDEALDKIERLKKK